MGSTSGSRRRRDGDGDHRTSLVGGGWRGEYGHGTPPGHRVPGYGGGPGAPDGRAGGALLRGFVEPEERAGLGGALDRLTGLLRRDDAGRRRRRRHGTAGGRGPLGGVPVIAVIAVVASVAVVAAALGISHVFGTTPAADTAAAPNPNCTLVVPANPLTAQGLATPYQLTATNPADGPCNEANGAQTAFVQGALLDPATGQVSVYNPLVLDAGSQPATAPVLPSLPAGAVVALWFGFNGGTLTLAGPDQAPSSTASPSGGATSPSASSSPSADSTASTSGTPSPSGTSSASTAPSSGGTPSPSGTASPTSAQSAAATPSGTGTPSGAGTPTSGPTSTGTPAATGTAAAASASAAGTAAPSSSRAGVQVVAAAPLPPAGDQANTWFDATLTSASGPGTYHHSHPSASPSPTGSASATTTATASPSPTGTVAASASPTATGAASVPPSNPGDGPAASGTPDATLQQANCVAGEEIGGQFSAFTQVGACNAVAFFAAANAAIKAGTLKVPAPGTGKDGRACLTTRSFALIDQDQSDNVTTEYLATGTGQTAQDTAANRQALGGAATLFNGSDNGLLDLFVDPALGCSPWQVPNLTDGGAPAPALPLDEIQAAAYTGGQGQPVSALVPLNDPMTLDNNGQPSTDKTNTYRSLVDMPPLPAGESPQAYCSDMERIQGKRLQQDVNLLRTGPSPIPAAADNLFDFLAMRLQQSYTNLNCGAFGVRNGVSTSVDGNGIVVAACFANHFSPVTSGPGNPMAGHRTCPATVGGPSGGAGSPSPSQSPGYYSQSSHHHYHHM